MSEHGMGGLDVDAEGWDFCRCDCGWVSPPCPDTGTALDFWGDHIMEVNGHGGKTQVEWMD